ncbi:MAG TPA: tRNA (adenosine(37)-N6)-threonylcarbamoyltransferase complex transferase subunit TsaD [Candidatus Udaeobacter sp.]|nr:tRNA (adenosine(37)-N6)-threonylcarbamoyltransferase complex transferase subunit TsaD [Candidatus Udaeobacter sp.]
MLILGIESSCDDTSVALLDSSEQGHNILFEKTASQIEIHKKYGGVVPEIAGRMHAEKIVPLIDTALAGQKKPDAIAVTAGPGLITGLLVGVEAARTLSYALKIPLIRTNHIEGHIYSVELQEKKSSIQFPALSLVVSGGHTELILAKKPGQYKLLGATKDDAAGECFDKVAKLLGLPYPGGPQISKFAETGNTKTINFPRPMMREENYLFSFAGLKTSALYWLRDNKLDNKITINDFCASFEQAIIDVLVAKTIKATQEYKPKTIILAGGVSANKKLRQTLEQVVTENFPETNFMLPQMKYAMDNGAMIAAAGYYHALKKDFTSWQKIQADPNWELTIR